jgi:concentrative nucleoside transporter, CNT family
LDDSFYRLISLLGFGVLSFLAWGTGTRGKVEWKTVVGGGLLAWGIGMVVFLAPGSRAAIRFFNDAFVAFLSASGKGAIFLFGPLALGPGMKLPDGTSSIGFVLAFQVLPSVIFFSGLVGLLYHFGVMQAVVRFFARIFYGAMKLSGAESLAASANIFVGIESGLAIRKYIPKMTTSELMTILTCMMATVASTVMAVYVIALNNVFDGVAGHLVSASIISIPCAVMMSKLACPETGEPETRNMNSVIDQTKEKEDLNKSAGAMTALIEGGTQGVQMAMGITALLIVVLGLKGGIDLILGNVSLSGGGILSLDKILEWVALPFAILLGLRPEEWQAGAQLLGSRFIETEVSAYFQLAGMQAGNQPTFSPRSLSAMTYALCGFVHIASLSIFVGGLSRLIPERTGELSLLGVKALWVAFLATLATGCIAGVLSF